MTDTDSLADPPRSLRAPDRSAYPELEGMSRDAIYEDTFGGGALYLAARIARGMGLQPGDAVLDLGAGRGASSVFLARRYGVQVVALDLWTPADHLTTKAARLGLRGRILPLQMDVTHPLPFATGYFDAIFCQNSLNFYGGSIEFLHHLLRCLKPGGAFGVGMETLSGEFTAEERANPPAVFNYNLPPPYEQVNTWVEDFSKMHSSGWWAGLCRACGLLDVLACGEVEDAEILYEDLIRYQMEHGLDPDDVAISLEQLAWGRAHAPRMTLMILQARKHTWAERRSAQRRKQAKEPTCNQPRSFARWSPITPPASGGCGSASCRWTKQHSNARTTTRTARCANSRSTWPRRTSAG